MAAKKKATRAMASESAKAPRKRNSAKKPSTSKARPVAKTPRHEGKKVPHAKKIKRKGRAKVRTRRYLTGEAVAAGKAMGAVGDGMGKLGAGFAKLLILWHALQYLYDHVFSSGSNLTQFIGGTSFLLTEREALKPKVQKNPLFDEAAVFADRIGDAILVARRGEPVEGVEAIAADFEVYLTKFPLADRKKVFVHVLAQRPDLDLGLLPFLERLTAQG